MTNIKPEARRLLDWCVSNYSGSPSPEEQSLIRGEIGFAANLGLITEQEAAEYCRKIGMEKAARLYERFAEIKEEAREYDSSQRAGEA